MASTTITKLSKNKILKARAGIKALPAVTHGIWERRGRDAIRG